MADQRITGVNLSSEGGTLKPPAYDELDYQRCADLHNHLVERGLQASGDCAVNTKTWWELYGSSTVSQKLHPVLQEFLKRAWVSWDGSSQAGQLFWNIGSIPSPDELFSNGINQAYRGLKTLDHNIYNELDSMYYAEEDECSNEEDKCSDDDNERANEEADDDGSGDAFPVDLEQYRFVTLYQSKSCAEDKSPLGVIYDQKLQLAVFVTSIEDIPTLLNGHNTSKLTALECILDTWHILLDREKVVKRNGKWEMQAFAPVDLSEAIRAWNDLVDDIERRIVDCDECLLEPGPVRTLLDPAAAATPVLSGFRHNFLTTARRPRFQWIAPGIRVPTSDELAERIQAIDQEREDEPDTRQKPLLLFAIPEPNAVDDSYTWPSHYRSSLTQQVDIADANSELLFPFAKGIKPDASFAPGLYLSSTGEDEEVPHADAFRLVLPFTLGSNGLTWRHDFTWEQGEKEVIGILGHKSFMSSPRYAELYQIGNGVTSGIPRHDAQLAKLFYAWQRQVSFGAGGWGLHFEDSAGVIGQIEGVITGVGIIEEYASSFQRSGNYGI